MVIYLLENPKDSTTTLPKKSLLGVINKREETKPHTRTSVAFLFTNKEPEEWEIKDSIPKDQIPWDESQGGEGPLPYKLQEIFRRNKERTHRNGGTFLATGLEEWTLLKRPFYQKQSSISVQSLSRSQCLLKRNWTSSKICVVITKKLQLPKHLREIRGEMEVAYSQHQLILQSDSS